MLLPVTTPATVILRDVPPSGGARWLIFQNPAHTLQTRRHNDIPSLLKAVEQAVADGFHAAGFVTYEASPAFDTAFRVVPPAATALPLLWFGIYRRVAAHDTLPPAVAPPPQLSWSITDDAAAHAAGVARIRGHIAAGDIYQANYTTRLRTAFHGDPWALFNALVTAQPTNHAAWVRLENHTICSASPELFFSLADDSLTCRPMKGTAARGDTRASDERARRDLHHSIKDRAENIMITDMVRNDLGRIAAPGSVRAAPLFTVEAYPTVWQMTSTVTARSQAGLADIFKALFPCASITGAPKVRSMAIIAALETAPRGIYTGAIGYIAPPRRASFSVAIRTVVIDHAAASAEYGTGGGIVWDSQAAAEYAELLAKARLLGAPPADTRLLETILWRPQRGWFLLRGHLRRLAFSAERLGYRCDPAAVRRHLEEAVAGATTPLRVRLTLARDGTVSVTTAAAPPAPARPWRLRLAEAPLSHDLPLLRHKTTWRALYDSARAAAADCDDVLLWNTRRELTETTIANIALRLNGHWYTPPLASGLIPGVYRAHLLQTRRVSERVLTCDDLALAEALAVYNSLRGWLPATMQP